MSNPGQSGGYAHPDVDMNGLLVATCRPDQAGQFPPIYDVPHGTIQLAPQFNSIAAASNWAQGPGAQPTPAAAFPGAMYSPFPTTSAFGNTRARPEGGAEAPESSTQGQARHASEQQAPQPKSEEGGSGASGEGAEGTQKQPSKRRSMAKSEKDVKTGRRKIKIEFIDDDSRRHITFSKRKAGIMKKAYELATLTGTQVLLLVVSQTGLVYTFTTPKLEAVVKQPEGRNLIQECLNAPDPPEWGPGTSTGAGPSSDAYTGDVNEQDEDQDEEEEADNAEEDDPVEPQAQTQHMAPRDSLGESARLFHPGAPPAATPDADRRTPSNVKRRRTQANLAAAAAAAAPPQPSMPSVPSGMYPGMGGQGFGNRMSPDSMALFYDQYNAAEAQRFRDPLADVEAGTSGSADLFSGQPGAGNSSSPTEYAE